MVESNFNIDAPRFFLGDKGYANDNTMIVPFFKNSKGKDSFITFHKTKTNDV